MIRFTRDKTSLNYARYEISSLSHGTLVLLLSLDSIMGFPITGQVNTHRAFPGCPFANIQVSPALQSRVAGLLRG